MKIFTSFSRAARLALFPLLSSVVLVACSSDKAPPLSNNPDPIDTTTPPTPTPPPPGTAVTPTLTRTTVIEGLSSPWDIAFASDGTMFFTEKCSGLSVRRTNGTVTRLFGTSGSSLIAADLFCESQSGMHGVALDPDFATNRRIYVFFASNLTTNPRASRVARLELNADYTVASGRTDIVTGIAFKDAANAISGVGMHSGGRIRFGPDGFLYITTGDNHNAVVPQSPTLLGGKVLRVTTSGAAAPGNNAPSGFDARIYTYGHRNPQGITFRPSNGQAFIAEHGPNHTDEVTALVAGGNGGWDPQNRPALTCPSNYCGYAGDGNTMPMTDLTRFPGALPASWINEGESYGMGPATFLSGTQWSAWDGRLAIGLMGRGRLAILQLNAAGVTTAFEDAAVPSRRYRSLVQGPDGSLYVSTDAGEIWRFVPSVP